MSIEQRLKGIKMPDNTEPQTHVAVRQVAEKFLSWLDTRGINICSRSFGENRKMGQEELSTAVDDFVYDYVKNLP